METSSRDVRMAMDPIQLTLNEPVNRRFANRNKI